MYVKWPQSAPFLKPPATAKFALAPGSEGEAIHPPPVTKSEPEHDGGGPGQVMSACADETTMSATSVTTTCNALTVISPGPEVDCSLMITSPTPSGSATVWFGIPVTSIACPLITSRAISELPLVDAPPGPHFAIALAIRKSAAIEFPPAV